MLILHVAFVSTLDLTGYAEWIYNSDDAIYEENGTYHISSTYFLELSIREPLLDVLASFINPMQIGSLVSIIQGTDRGIEAITTWLGRRLNKPIIPYTEGEYDALSTKISSN